MSSLLVRTSVGSNGDNGGNGCSNSGSSSGGDGSNNRSTTSVDETSVDGLVQMFRCFICMERLQDARLCPHCSKLACLTCIHKWLTRERPQCPHCRAPLFLNELVNCRWAEEVNSQLDSLQQSSVLSVRRQESGAIGRQTAASLDVVLDCCVEHDNEKLSVFCDTCLLSICHQCALWGGTHVGHLFRPLEEVWSEQNGRVVELLTKLRRCHSELADVGAQIQRNIDTVNQAKDECEREIINAAETMIMRLNNVEKAKQSKLISQRNRISNESQELISIIERVDGELERTSKPQLIERSATYVNLLQELQGAQLAASPARATCSPVAADFSSEIVPAYESCTFELKSFSDCRLKADPVYSNELVVNGLCWRLKVYPDGNLVVRGQYLSVFLELTAGVPEPCKYEYRVEMVHLATATIDTGSTEDLSGNSRNVSRSFASDFEVGECWGYNRFFRLDQLGNEGFLDLERDTLILRFHVRPPSFYQRCRDQQWYIEHLEASQARYQHELASLKQRITSTSRRNNSTGISSRPLASLLSPTAAAANQSSMSESAHSDGLDDHDDVLSTCSIRSVQPLLEGCSIVDENDVDNKRSTRDFDVATGGSNDGGSSGCVGVGGSDGSDKAGDGRASGKQMRRDVGADLATGSGGQPVSGTGPVSATAVAVAAHELANISTAVPLRFRPLRSRSDTTLNHRSMTAVSSANDYDDDLFEDDQRLLTNNNDDDANRQPIFSFYDIADDRSNSCSAGQEADNVLLLSVPPSAVPSLAGTAADFGHRYDSLLFDQSPQSFGQLHWP